MFYMKSRTMLNLIANDKKTAHNYPNHSKPMLRNGFAAVWILLYMTIKCKLTLLMFK